MLMCFNLIILLAIISTMYQTISKQYLVGGFNPSEKYEFVSWDYYSQYLEKHVPNHQPDTYE